VKPHRLLIATSLLSVLLVAFHLTDDIVRGVETGGTANLLAIPILATWLYGALVLTGRRPGYVISLLGSLLGAVIPALHFTGPGGVTGEGGAQEGEAFRFIWVLVALGVTSTFGAILSSRGLWISLASRRPS
jgi:hypothetical protein